MKKLRESITFAEKVNISSKNNILFDRLVLQRGKGKENIKTAPVL